MVVLEVLHATDFLHCSQNQGEHGLKGDKGEVGEKVNNNILYKLMLFDITVYWLNYF